MNQNFQGDIAIITISELPKDITMSRIPDEGVVCATGEVTGHKHLLVADEPALVEVGKNAAGFWLKVLAGANASLVHEEHATQAIPAGFHFIGRQVEYDELGEKKVAD